MTTPAKDSDPVLITGAAPSYEEQFAARKRKYVIMMACRIPCLILAGLTYPYWNNTGQFWTAGAIVLVAALWTMIVRAQAGGAANGIEGSDAIGRAAVTEIARNPSASHQVW